MTRDSECSQPLLQKIITKTCSYQIATSFKKYD